ncbi:MAG: magnesium transporter [Rubrivivax sp.]|jgi:magnesium transporter|nr:magnesium transporter [Rubrivivax sp.]
MIASPRRVAETSAERVNPHALRAHPAELVALVRHRLHRHGHAWDLLCVVDADDRLLGTLTPQELAGLPDPTPVGQAMHREGPRVGAGTDQEEMATLALQHGVTAMPVVDAAGRLVGVVGPHELMDVLRREHVEDLHRLAGITRETTQAREAIEAPPLRRARHRLPWLLVGLVGSAIATAVVARFESALAAKPALAFFVPGLVYLADAIGTQSEAVAVRGLSLSRSGVVPLLGGELRTGALIGLVLAALALPMVWAVFGEIRLAVAVALALGAASTIAAMLGLVLPWLLSRLRLDPAYGSGPLATIIQDVLSLLIYFGFVSIVVL